MGRTHGNEYRRKHASQSDSHTLNRLRTREFISPCPHLQSSLAMKNTPGRVGDHLRRRHTSVAYRYIRECIASCARAPSHAARAPHDHSHARRQQEHAPRPCECAPHKEGFAPPPPSAPAPREAAPCRGYVGTRDGGDEHAQRLLRPAASERMGAGARTRTRKTQTHKRTNECNTCSCTVSSTQKTAEAAHREKASNTLRRAMCQTRAHGRTHSHRG